MNHTHIVDHYGLWLVTRRRDYSDAGTEEDENSERSVFNNSTVDVDVSMDQERDIIDALSIAAEVHPKGPTIIIMRARGRSYRTIAKQCDMSDVHVKRLHMKIRQHIEGRSVTKP